jgi:hypothetical protein
MPTVAIASWNTKHAKSAENEASRCTKVFAFKSVGWLTNLIRYEQLLYYTPKIPRN